MIFILNSAEENASAKSGAHQMPIFSVNYSVVYIFYLNLPYI